jgi:branched-chain amino acid transport system ATP-binding protein
LTAGYGDIRALWDLSLTVRAGEITVLFGRNGAGKTTALSTISGILKANAGSIRFNGRDVTSTPVHQRVRLGIALVQENKRIFRRRSVEENLRLGGFWRYPRKRDLSAAMEREFERFPILQERRRLPASTLSGGEQQMLAISQALLAQPSVLMLDEPSAGLAPEIVNRVLKAILELKEQGLGILLVEQLVHQALQIANHVGVLELGRLAMSKPANEVGGASEIQAVYFGTSQLDR